MKMVFCDMHRAKMHREVAIVMRVHFAMVTVDSLVEPHPLDDTAILYWFKGHRK